MIKKGSDRNWGQTQKYLLPLRWKGQPVPCGLFFGTLPAAASHFSSDISGSTSSWRVGRLLCQLFTMLVFLSFYCFRTVHLQQSAFHFFFLSSIPEAEAYIFPSFWKPMIWSSARRRPVRSRSCKSGRFWSFFFFSFFLSSTASVRQWGKASPCWSREVSPDRVSGGKHHEIAYGWSENISEKIPGESLRILLRRRGFFDWYFPPFFLKERCVWLTVYYRKTP